MLPIRRAPMALCCALLVPAALAQSSPLHPQVEAFATLPQAEAPSLSPDGTHLALIGTLKGRPVAVIYTLDSPGHPPVVLPDNDGLIVGVQWANNDRLLITININTKIVGYDVMPFYRTVSVDSSGKNGVTLFSNMPNIRDHNFSGSAVIDLAPDDPDHIYMDMDDYTASEQAVPTVFRVDVTTGAAEHVVYGRSGTNGWIMDGHGNVVAQLDLTPQPWTERLLLRTGDDSWKEIASHGISNGNELTVAGLNEDGTALILGGTDKQTGMQGLVARNLADGKSTPVFFDSNYDVDGVLRDPWTGRVLGAIVIADQPEYHYFDPKLEALQRGLEQAFSGLNVHAVDWDRSLQKVIVVVEGPRQPPAYFLLDRTTHKATFLTKSYPELTRADLGVEKPYPYTARDGLRIPAYLTLPPGKAPKYLPTVIMPHGGPQYRDAFGFDWLAQFLANRGYAVLQPNFRGSTGYGRKFEQAGFGQWGLKMQDDITDGVKKLIADGIADPKRICIAGASYGGYAALAGAAFTPNLYACAFSWAGVTDLQKLYDQTTGGIESDTPTYEWWKLYFGADSDRLEAESPVDNVDKIVCPVLLMQGTKDYTVRIDQGAEMDRALEDAGKKVTFIKIDGETHYMQKESTRVRVLTELEKFLKANIGD